MAALAATSAPQAEDPIAQPAAGGQGIRCTAVGHVLAFRPDGMIVAAGDYALKLEFVESHPREPQASGRCSRLSASCPSRSPMKAVRSGQGTSL